MGCGYVHCHETPPVYALIDVNSMYRSCEEAFRLIYEVALWSFSQQRDRRLLPSIARRALGVRRGEPYFRAAAACWNSNNVAVFSSNFTLTPHSPPDLQPW